MIISVVIITITIIALVVMMTITIIAMVAMMMIMIVVMVAMMIMIVVMVLVIKVMMRMMIIVVAVDISNKSNSNNDYDDSKYNSKITIITVLALPTVMTEEKNIYITKAATVIKQCYLI